MSVATTAWLTVSLSGGDAWQPVDTQLTSIAGLSYTGNSLKVMRVNAGETGFELATITSGPSAANPTATIGLTAVNGAAATFLRSDGAPALDVGIAPTWTAVHTFSQAIEATSTDGIVLSNPIAATVGAQKWSPRLRLHGSGWGTTAGAAQDCDFIAELQPFQGANPSISLVLSSSLNGGAYAARMTLTSAGNVAFGGDVTGGNFKSVSNTALLQFGASADAYFCRAAAADWRLGLSAANPPVAQTLSVQDASGTDIAGAAWTFRGSRGTGNAAAGLINFAIADAGSTGTTLQTATTKAQINRTGLVIPKTTNYGIQVDTTTPTWGWRDIIGHVQPKTTGAGTPAYGAYQGNINGYKFIANDIIDFVFHMPHDYVPGTDLHLHIHWSHNGTAITGNVVFTHYSTYAKGFNQAAFPAEVTSTITYATVDVATTPRYQHRIDEIALSTAGGSAALLNTTNLEVDGLILIRVIVTTLPTITGGDLFIHTADLHYQSTNMATKAKAGPGFYT